MQVRTKGGGGTVRWACDECRRISLRKGSALELSASLASSELLEANETWTLKSEVTGLDSRPFMDELYNLGQLLHPRLSSSSTKQM